MTDDLDSCACCGRKGFARETIRCVWCSANDCGDECEFPTMTDDLDLSTIEARHESWMDGRDGVRAFDMMGDVPALVARVRQLEALLDGWKVDMQHATVHYADWPEPARRLWDRWAEEMGRR